jgi:hypothetical protein
MKGDCSLTSRLRATHLILFPLWDKDYETLGKKQPIFQIQAKHSVCPRAKRWIGGGTNWLPNGFGRRHVPRWNRAR